MRIIPMWQSDIFPQEFNVVSVLSWLRFGYILREKKKKKAYYSGII